MKKYWGIGLFAFLLSFGVKAQNVVYDANAQVRKVSSFTGVDISNGIVLYLSQGTTQAVAVSANEDKYVEKIITKVENGILHISIDNSFWGSISWGNKKLKAYVTVTELTYLGLSGGSIGKFQDQIQVNELKAQVSGGSIMEGDFKGTSMKANFSGGSIAKLTGSFNELMIDLSGGSIFKDYTLSVNSCKIEASGGSIVNLTVNNDLKAEASGGSIINYKGSATISNVNTSGGSIIKKKDS